MGQKIDASKILKKDKYDDIDIKIMDIMAKYNTEKMKKELGIIDLGFKICRECYELGFQEGKQQSKEES